MGLTKDDIKNKRGFYLLPTIRGRFSKNRNTNKIRELVENVKTIEVKHLKVVTFRSAKPPKSFNRSRVFKIKLPKKLQMIYDKEFYKMEVSVESDNSLHRVHFPDGIPETLKGIGFGYKIYYKLLQTFDYISSADGASDEANNVWAKLVLDNNVHTVLLDSNVIVFKKSLPKYKKVKIFKKFLCVHCFEEEIELNKNLIVDQDLIDALEIPSKFKNPRHNRN